LRQGYEDDDQRNRHGEEPGQHLGRQRLEQRDLVPLPVLPLKIDRSRLDIRLLSSPTHR
jgi:hypothetical protein